MGKNTEAIVLKGIDYQETSRILRLVSEEYGKISAIAKGVRKEKSTLRGAVEPITLGVYHLNAGRNMFIISQAEILDLFQNIKNSLNSIVAASFIADLTDAFLDENNPDPETYSLIKTSLDCLNKNMEKSNEIALYFEINIHKIHGILPDIHKCISCGKTEAGRYVKIDVDKGGFLCSSCSGESPQGRSYPIDSLYVIQKASHLSVEKFINEDFSKIFLSAAGAIMAEFTRHYIGKELKSRHAFEMKFNKASEEKNWL